MKKAFLINPTTETIEPILIDDEIESMHKAIGCSAFDVASIDDRNDVYVDDEGLYTKRTYFHIKGSNQVLAGNGLVLGIDYETGQSVDTTLTLEWLVNNVEFVSPFELR